jgi:hypothetical protein
VILGRGPIKGHSLSIATGAILLIWLVLYIRSDPQKHPGNFFGNAIADWSGTLIMVLATKYLYEKGSKESKSPRPDNASPFPHFCRQHGLTIFLLITGTAWLIAYLNMDPNGRWGQVIGNLTSEWLQVLGLVIMTKYLGERGAKY